MLQGNQLQLSIKIISFKKSKKESKQKNTDNSTKSAEDR